MFKTGLFMLCALLSAAGQPSRLAKQMFESNDVTRTANVGVLVVDAATGDTIDAYRADNLLPSASTMKVVSTCTALELLGADYRWNTYLETDGELVGNTLLGNLYIRGTGDPTLASLRLVLQQRAILYFFSRATFSAKLMPATPPPIMRKSYFFTM